MATAQMQCRISSKRHTISWDISEAKSSNYYVFPVNIYLQYMMCLECYNTCVHVHATLHAHVHAFPRVHILTHAHWMHTWVISTYPPLDKY